jgi:hypothetical protein
LKLLCVKVKGNELLAEHEASEQLLQTTGAIGDEDCSFLTPSQIQIQIT